MNNFRFQELIYPVGKDVFFRDYYEKCHLHIKKTGSHKLDWLLSIEELDSILFSTVQKYPNFRLANNALETPLSSYSYTYNNSDIIDPLKFTNEFNTGNTLVLSSLNDFIFSLRSICNELENFFKHRVQTNIYLTPANSQGFKTHYDSHDVFVIQFEGSKNWRIYDEPIDLPNESMSFSNNKTYKPGKLIDEFTLEKGDVLYIPRGYAHDASSAGEISGHITVGLVGKTWAEHLSEAILNKSSYSRNLRKFTKLHTVPGVDYDVERQEVLKTVMDILNNLEIDQSIINNFDRNRKSLALGHLNEILQLPSITVDSEVLFREQNKMEMIPEGETLHIKFYELYLGLPLECTPFLNKLMDRKDFVKISAIDCPIEMDDRVEICRLLCEVGALTFR